MGWLPYNKPRGVGGGCRHPTILRRFCLKRRRVSKGEKGKEKRKKTHGKTSMWQKKDKTTNAKGEYGGGNSGRWWAWARGV